MYRVEDIKVTSNDCDATESETMKAIVQFIMHDKIAFLNQRVQMQWLKYIYGTPFSFDGQFFYKKRSM